MEAFDGIRRIDDPPDVRGRTLRNPALSARLNGGADYYVIAMALIQTAKLNEGHRLSQTVWTAPQFVIA
jgi:hypothetical protein